MKTKMETKITILKNEYLERIHGRCKGSIDMVIDKILTTLVNERMIYLDDTELCGLMLSDVVHEYGKTLTWLVNKVFGTCTFELLDNASKLQIWGIDDDCDMCGCEMIDNKCTNCDNTRSTGEDFDFDRYFRIGKYSTYSLN
jgi:hypothetical protein